MFRKVSQYILLGYRLLCATIAKVQEEIIWKRTVN